MFPISSPNKPKPKIFDMVLNIGLVLIKSPSTPKANPHKLPTTFNGSSEDGLSKGKGLLGTSLNQFPKESLLVTIFAFS